MGHRIVEGKAKSKAMSFSAASQFSRFSKRLKLPERVGDETI
jgi:hypothetical protein